MLRFLSQNGCLVFSHKTGAWLSFIATWILTIPNLSVINHRYFDFDDTKSLGYHFFRYLDFDDIKSAVKTRKKQLVLMKGKLAYEGEKFKVFD